MTREEFIEILDKIKYPYTIEGSKLVITRPSGIFLDHRKNLPPDIVFGRPAGDVYLQNLTSLPHGVEFRNRGDVYLESIKSISPGVVFDNGGRIANLGLIVGGWLEEWKGNIEGIDPKRLLDKMISLGLFDKER
jgi:hypothetical protein